MESILVLNNDYTPINVTGIKRAFNLIYLGKAEVINHNDFFIRTEKRTFNCPTIIRLLRYVTVPFRKVSLSRDGVYKRDGYQCLYCGEDNRKELTLDHVIPKSKGGKNTWENLVTCCKSCNVKKDNKSLEGVGFTLSHKPYKPTYIQFIKNINVNSKEDWIPYLRT